MGIALDFICDKCSYNRRFYIGCGLNYDISAIFYNDMRGLRRFVESTEERMEIRYIMSCNPDALISGSENRIYYCPHCGELQANYYFKIHYENKEYFPHYYCPRCETVMEPLDMNWKAMRSEPLDLFNYKGKPVIFSCPDCGSNEIRFYDGGFDWD